MADPPKKSINIEGDKLKYYIYLFLKLQICRILTIYYFATEKKPTLPKDAVESIKIAVRLKVQLLLVLVDFKIPFCQSGLNILVVQA